MARGITTKILPAVNLNTSLQWLPTLYQIKALGTTKKGFLTKCQTIQMDLAGSFFKPPTPSFVRFPNSFGCIDAKIFAISQEVSDLARISVNVASKFQGAVALAKPE